MLYAPEVYGGIECFNVRLKVISLKITWLAKILEDRDCTSLSIGRFFLQNFDKSFKGLNVITTKVKNSKNDNIPVFYQDMPSYGENLAVLKTC